MKDALQMSEEIIQKRMEWHWVEHGIAIWNEHTKTVVCKYKWWFLSKIIVRALLFVEQKCVTTLKWFQDDKWSLRLIKF